MFRTRVLLGALMIAALASILLLDGWMSRRALSMPAGDVGPATGRIGGQEFYGGRGYPAVRPQVIWCGLPTTLLVLALTLLACYEMAALLQSAGYRPIRHWAALISAGLVLLPYVQMQQRLLGLHFAAPPTNTESLLPLLWLTGGTLGTGLAVLGRRTTAGAIGAMGSTLLMMLYVGLLASFAVRLRCLWPGPAGAAILALAVLTIKAGDIGAYFTGSLIGRHKLAPWLSPGKTVEGVAGAIVLAAVVAAGAVWLWSRWATVVGRLPLDYTQALAFGIVMAIAGHIGDLIESAMKRDAGAKDSGRAIPAFGGLLDLLDSPLFAVPVAWWLLTLWTRID